MNGKQAACKSFAKVIDKEQALNFHSYSYTPQGIIKAPLFEEQGGEISLVPQEAISVSGQTFLIIVIPTLLPNKLETGESVTFYNYQQVLRQFGYE